MGKSIKLLAMSKALENGTLAMVSPCLIDQENPLYPVQNVFNAILVKGNMQGETMYYGKGAGKLATASAVVADVIECARNAGRTLPVYWDSENEQLVDIAEVERAFFVRAKAEARAEVEAAFAGGEAVELPGRDDFGYVTTVMKEKDFAAKYEALADKVISRIRIEA